MTLICPHCLRTIDDGTAFCPHCHAYVSGGTPSRSSFVYCEGCGARLSRHDRTCPKCGRPAPGILSTASASSDLAAGKTASFPRLTQKAMETELPDLRHDAMTAAQVAVDSVDPFATGVLKAEDIEAASVASARGAMPMPPASEEDPYHDPVKKSKKPLVITLILIVLLGGGAAFVYFDPLGVMPVFMEQLKLSASEMYPSRWIPEGSAAQASADVTAEAEADKAKNAGGVLTDAQAYQQLRAAYNTITAQHDALETIIDDYNSGFEASDYSTREQYSASAYEARDTIDDTVEELQAMELSEGSAYTDEVQNLVELAGWVRTRIDMYCASWDISLSYTGDDLPYLHEDEILAPLRERVDEDAEARDSYFAHLSEYEPQEPEQ